MCKKCSICGSDWIYKGPKGIHHLCEDCYTTMNKEVIEYHTIQKEAHTNAIDGDVQNTIRLLGIVQEKRNELNKYFNNTLNEGHRRFANDFIPALIANLSKKNIIPNDIWNSAFASLSQPENFD